MRAITLYDVDIFARTIYGEARSEWAVGMYAVAAVIMNRVGDRRWPNEVAQVCRQRWQFSCWNPVTVPDKCQPDANVMAMLNAGFERVMEDFAEASERVLEWKDMDGMLFTEPAFAHAYGAAFRAVGGTVDPTHGATHYYVRGTPEPRWAKGRTPCVEIGRHLFFNDVP